MDIDDNCGDTRSMSTSIEAAILWLEKVQDIQMFETREIESLLHIFDVLF